jgi:hypothetical protein
VIGLSAIFSVSGFFYLSRRPEIRLIIATNMADPIIDQRMGNECPPMLGENTNGRSKTRASHLPKSAPMNPNAIETRQPPWEYPAIVLPIEPHMDATISNKSNPSMFSIP